MLLARSGGALGGRVQRVLRSLSPSLASWRAPLLCSLPLSTNWTTLASPSRSFATSSISNSVEKQLKTPKLSVKQVLAGRPSSTYTVNQTDSIKQAINHLVTKKISSSLILDSAKEIVGIVTARDLLRFVNDLITPHSSGGSQRAVTSRFSTEALLQHKVTEVMTPMDRMIFCSPKDTVKHCREIMFQMKIRHLPVIQHDTSNNSMVVVGIVTMSDLSDAEFNNVLHGGKKGYIYNVIGRKGLPRGTHVLDPSSSSSMNSTNHSEQQISNLSDHHHSLSRSGSTGYSSSSGGVSVVRSGSYTLPHPFKTATSVAGDRRQYGAEELCFDNDLNEDAHFVMTVQLPNLLAPSSQPCPINGVDCNRDTLEQVYACVADGVGSWRAFGVDPKLYSHRLVANTQSVIQAETTRRLEDYVLYQASHRRQLSSGKGVDASESVHSTAHERGRGGEDLLQGDETVHPLDALYEAWHMTNKDQHIIGSSTICVATIDVSTNQLSYSNIGDGGLMVVRHVPTDGTLNAKVAPTTHTSAKDASYNNTNYKIAYLAQQQLRSFNFPFQLGNGGPDHDGVFEQPMDADTASIPLMPKDIVVMASDGLFDNLEISEIIAIISEWEQEQEPEGERDEERSGSSAGSGGNENELREREGVVFSNSSHDERTQALAKALVEAAREASLDKHKDSPFALLAKENDIMWGGGMPDDTTVVILQLLAPPPATRSPFSSVP